MSSPVLDDALLLELAALEREVSRRLFLRDPVAWATQRLGASLWSSQQSIMQAVATHRRVAVRSCHAAGKSFTAASLAAWWLDIVPVGDAFVVTSAPSAPQVKSILWREIGRCHTRGHLRGRVNQTEWYQPTRGGKEELVAIGRKPDAYDPAAFQGIHSSRVLVILDEANGIRGPLHDAADTLIANDESKILMIGNPDDPSGEFFDACKPGSGWHVIEINAFDTPNFTGEDLPAAISAQLIGRTYVEEKRRKWAPDWYWVNADGIRCEASDGVRCVPPDGVDPSRTNPLWQSKILGRFPERLDAGGLIPLSWIMAAQQRTLDARGPNELGLDVGGGGDATCLAHRRGPVVRIIHEDHNPDTMQTCGLLLSQLHVTGAARAKVDEIGIGRGVVDRAKEQKKAVIGINVGSAAIDPEAFVNRRAELWWDMRERFEAQLIDIDPNDDDLAGELAEIHYKRLSSGKIQIESKDEAKRRGVPSPNRADAVMLAFAPEPQPIKPVVKPIW